MLVLALNAPKQAQLLEYRDYAQQLCQPGLYEDCVTYINSILPQLGKFKDTQTVGEIYYLQGESYFEQEQYQAAIAAYDAAGIYLTDSLYLLRDTAIAHARSGNIDRAESQLQNMRALPDSEGAVALLLGEIAFAREQYDEALTQLKKGLGLPNSSDHARYRAYLICDKAFRKLEGKEKDNIALLRKALTDLPQVYSSILSERLADAYSRDGQYSEAVAIFEQLRDGGDTRIGTLQNIGLLYQQMKQYGKARAAYEAMRATYPKQHEGPMRLCYLVLAEQAEKPNEQRDYAEAQQLFAEAQRLYDGRPVASGEDMEMQKLAGAMEELEANGWGEVESVGVTTKPATNPKPTNETNDTTGSAIADWINKILGGESAETTKINSGTPPTIITTEMPDMTMGVPFYFKLQATGTEPIRWKHDALQWPDGLILDEETGILSGTPVNTNNHSSYWTTSSIGVTASNEAGEVRANVKFIKHYPAQ